VVWWSISATAKVTFLHQTFLFHGKTFFSMAKLTFTRQNILSQQKLSNLLPSNDKILHGQKTGTGFKQNEDGNSYMFTT